MKIFESRDSLEATLIEEEVLNSDFREQLKGKFCE